MLPDAPLFADLPDDHKSRLAAAAEPRSFQAGQTVVFRGTTVDGVYSVVSGGAVVSVKTQRGAVVEAGRLGPGDVFGETSILDNGTAAATVKAGADGVQLVWIPEAAFRQALDSSPELRRRVEAIIDERKRRNAGLAQDPR